MGASSVSRSMPDSYFELIKKFPLVPIQDDDHLDEAVEVLEGLLAEDLDAGGQAYLEVLTGLVAEYEEENVEIPDASEADVLRELMRVRGLTQGKLAKEVGITQSTISAVLNGTRTLTRGQVVKLANYFHVSAAVFLPMGMRKGR